MGQACPRTAPPQQYTPTQCQGSSTGKADKSKLNASQSSVESKVVSVSRGASCTQDDIRRSFRKEKELDGSSSKPTGTHDNKKAHHHGHNKNVQRSQKEHHHQKVENSQATAAGQVVKDKPKHEVDHQAVPKEHKKQHRHHHHHHHHHHRQPHSPQQQQQPEQPPKYRDLNNIVREDFENVHNQNRQLKGDRYYMAHQTHEIQQKGSMLEIQSVNTARQQGQSKRHHHNHHHNHHHHHHHQKGTTPDNRQLEGAVARQTQEPKTQKVTTQVEYNTQNAHNANISARRLQVPNNSSTPSGHRSHREKGSSKEASPRGSLKEKRAKGREGRGKSVPKARVVENPVYSLPPLVK